MDLFVFKKGVKHYQISILGVSLKLPYPMDWLKIWKFFRHDVSDNTVLIIEVNDCHYETILGYYKYLDELGYNVEILTRGMCENLFKDECNLKVWECGKSTFDFIFRHFDFSKYYCLLYNSERTYWYNPKFGEGGSRLKDGYDLSCCYKKLPQGQKESIYVQHHIDMYDKSSNDKQIVLANPQGDKKLEPFVVNPHYFGGVNITPKNSGKTKFVTVGALDVTRRNSAILIKAVEELHLAGMRNFEVIVVGMGKFDKIDSSLHRYFRIMGRLDFPKMFKAMEEADYFLPLLDPESENHERYKKHGTSGSFQLIYGFLKPCIIHKTFADIYGFCNKNSIIYNTNLALYSAMQKAIVLSAEDYSSMQNELKKDVQKIEKVSRKNLESLLT